ncbi:MAG: hypothetical protein K0U72_03730 [Gammaproteobacteria bacterium]|nr:hypothetical protein [Gammaproteobacteria bacterium]
MYSKQLTCVFIALFVAAIPPQVEAKPGQHRDVVHTKALKTLPSAHHRIRHRGKSYFYSSGRFYRHGSDGYVAIVAPLGAVIPVLPRDHLSFGVGVSRYFYFGGVYYRPVDEGFVVIEKPENAETPASGGSDRLIIYPAAGQSDETRDKDRYECHTWAKEETGFDPTDATSDTLLRADYQRAQTACLEARKYIVK